MNDVSLKAKIRNISKDKNISAQAVLQNYLMNRFLYRLSKTEYVLIQMGLPDADMVHLFRSFLCMYDVKTSKMKEIVKVCENEEEKILFQQLYLLPGVKAVRARLYASANYTDLFKIAAASPQQIISDTEKVITQNRLNIKVPLLKEVRTHIAVAKMLTEYKFI